MNRRRFLSRIAAAPIAVAAPAFLLIQPKPENKPERPVGEAAPKTINGWAAVLYRWAWPEGCKPKTWANHTSIEHGGYEPYGVGGALWRLLLDEAKEDARGVGRCTASPDGRLLIEFWRPGGVHKPSLSASFRAGRHASTRWTRP